MSERRLKKILMVAIGILCIFIAVIFPFPRILGVSGIIWRIVIGLLGCIFITCGICNKKAD